MHQQWDDIVSEKEREIIRKGGYGNRKDLGRKPALIVIDAQYNFFGDRSPTLEQMEKYPTGVGSKAWESLDKSVSLIKAARIAKIPVIYTRYVAQKSGRSHESKMKRDHAKFQPESKGSQIVKEMAPMGDEVVIDKQYASAFFGTSLINHLVSGGADTLLFIGGTTSGCVRTSAIDASNYGFNSVIVEDCVFDRLEVSHKVALLDVWMKYGTLVTHEQALDYFNTFLR